MKLKTFRIISQVVFFSAFLILFLFTVFPNSVILPVELFPELDPLVAFVSMIASRDLIHTMVPALVILLLTLIVGRFFCGYVCPLGSIIDFSQWVMFRKNRKKETLEPKHARKVKYFILIGVLLGSFVGLNALSVFSPMSITPRVFTTVFFPAMIGIINGILDLFRPAIYKLGFDNLAQLNFDKALFSGGVAVFILFTFIIVANYWQRRFWCRYVCPTGAFLTIFSRFGIVKRKVNLESCNSCKRCMTECNTRAITLDGKGTVLTECTLCGDCTAVKNDGCNSIGLTSFGFAGNDASIETGRRSFILSSAAGLMAAAVIKGEPDAALNTSGRFIRPPGSLPEPDFLARCIRCGLCVKTCKTYGLQPAGFEKGLDGLWTPHLVPRIGGCEEKCHACGYVCPTRAIRDLPLEEKRFVKIGTAVIDKERCITWENDKTCLICDEICPYDAIEFRIVQTSTSSMKRPFVIADKCTGCGLCETKCPISGRSAIEVYSIGEERKKNGSYITEEKLRLRQVKDDPIPGGFITDD